MARIFIVEGEDHGAEALTASLRAAGHEIAGTAISTFEANDRVARNRPDLALVDVRSRSGGDHVELAAGLERRFGLPVVLMSEAADAATMRRIGRASPAGFLLRPFDDRQLRAAVELALVRRASEVARRREAERVEVAGRLRLLSTLAGGIVRALDAQLAPADRRALAAELDALARAGAPRTVPLHAVAARAVAELRERLGHRAVFELDGQPEVCVSGDEAHLVRAVGHAAAAALHAHGTGAGTWVRLQVGVAEGGQAQVELAVTCERDVTGRPPVPTGLPAAAALALAEAILTTHGGALTWERESARTVARVTLPAVVAEEGRTLRLATAG